MAVNRPTPKCIHCEKPVAKAVYNDRPSKNWFGDTFSHWNYFDCECKASKEESEIIKKIAKGIKLK
jgi:hypothetical protein